MFALEIHDIIHFDERIRAQSHSLGEHLVHVPLICHRGEKESAVRKATLDEYECSPFSIHAVSSRSVLRVLANTLKPTIPLSTLIYYPRVISNCSHSRDLVLIDPIDNNVLALVIRQYLALLDHTQSIDPRPIFINICFSTDRFIIDRGEICLNLT